MNNYFNYLGLSQLTVEIQSYGSPGSLGGLIPFVLFGYQERQNGYKNLLNPLINTNTTFTFTDTGTSYIFDYVPTFGIVNKGVVITCKEYPYPSLVYAMSTDKIEIIATGYKLENSEPQQFTEPLEIFRRDMFGKIDEDCINPSVYQLPSNYIENLLVIRKKLKIDTMTSIRSLLMGKPFVDPQPKITLYFFVKRI